MNPDHFASHTDVGRARSHNEDACIAAPPLFAVADGVGGAASGELASTTALDVLQSHAGSIATLGDDDAACTAMAEAVDACNAQIHADQLRDDTHAGMATTLTAAVVRADASVVIGHVGDSRAYLVHGNGSITQITDDHSMVGELIRSGQLQPHEASTHPQRNVITRALGPDPHVSVDTKIVTPAAGDWIVLCSDGLTNHVDDASLARVVLHAARAQDAAASLVDMANAAGGTDNISVVLVQPAGPAIQAPHVNPAELSGEIAIVPLEHHGADGSETTGHDLESRESDGADVAPTERGAQASTMLETAPSHRVRRLIVSALILLIAAGVGAWMWSQSYFITTQSGGMVVARHGFPIAGMSRVWQQTSINVRDLSQADRQRLVDRPTLRSRTDTERILRRLPELAGRCDQTTAAGSTPGTPHVPPPGC